MTFSRRNHGSKVMDPPQRGLLILLVDTCQTEGQVYDWPARSVSNRKFDLAIGQVDEPANNLCRLSLITFASIAPEDSKAEEQ